MTGSAPLTAGGGSWRLLASSFPLARNCRHTSTHRTEQAPSKRAPTMSIQNPASSLAATNQEAFVTGQLEESKLEFAANMFIAPFVASKVSTKGARSTSPHVRSAKCQSRGALVLGGSTILPHAGGRKTAAEAYKIPGPVAIRQGRQR